MTPRNWAEENVPRLKDTLWTGNIWKVAVELSKTKGVDFFVINADMGVGVLKKKEENVIYHDDFEKQTQKLLILSYQAQMILFLN